MRTSALQRRQMLVCCAAWVLPLLGAWIPLAYKLNVLSDDGWDRAALLRLRHEAVAGAAGCANVSAQLRQMCESRDDDAPTGTYETCEWCANELHRPCTPTRRRSFPRPYPPDAFPPRAQVRKRDPRLPL